jgi:putative membrane protein
MTENAESGDISTELAARRTGMAFHRTRLGAERTLMAVIRTSLSLIGFGFTIFQFFRKLKEAGTLARDNAPRHFGLALVYLGVGLLVLGLVFHLRFMIGLRAERDQLIKARLIHGESEFPLSITLVVGLLLLSIGLLAIVSMTWNVGPF